ncbi:MAG: hypothetical protein IKE63_05515 [Bacilli bacterium]|nr:hypothetical protein [Bacilli bacterium]
MNNFPYPIIFPNNCEIAIIREKLKELEERIKLLENEKNDNYLQEDNNYYMI